MPPKKKKGKLTNPARGYATTSLPKAQPKNMEQEPPQEDPPPQQPAPEPPLSDHQTEPLTSTNTTSPPDPDPDPHMDLTHLATKLSTLSTLKVDAYIKDSLTQETLLSRDNVPSFRLPSDLEHRALNVFRDTGTTLTNFECIPPNVESRVARERLLARLDVVYLTLERLEFKGEDVQEAMRGTLAMEVEDVLDWLCLHLPYERLPVGFADKVYHEDDMSITAVPAPARPPVADAPETLASSTPTPPKPNPTSGSEHPTDNIPDDSIKSWILRSMETAQSDDESDDESSGPASPSPNDAYATLKLRLITHQKRLNSARKRGDGATQGRQEDEIERVRREMKACEKRDGFNRREAEKAFVAQRARGESEAVADEEGERGGEEGGEGDDTTSKLEHGDDDDPTTDLFGSIWDSSSPAPDTTIIPTTTLRILNLTHLGWTGQHPKNILSTHVRTQDKRATVRFSRDATAGGWTHRARVEVCVSGKNRMFEMPSGVACETRAEAEEFVATLAMYNLTNLPLYRNLPTPYRDLWLGWQAEKDADLHRARTQVNTARLSFLTGLLELAAEKGADRTSTRRRSSAPSLDGTFDAPRPPEANLDPDTITPAGRARRDEFARRRRGRKYRELEAKRATLPIHAHRNEILAVLQANQVVIVSGETGCGKSTQVPQYIAESLMIAGSGDRCKVMCTQPRRISAISIARRVSLEMGDAAVGSPGSLVGYQIRLESRVDAGNALVFCTTGILLRRLETDPNLAGVTHVVVDEVHERTLESDFLLIVLRKLVGLRPDLKVILMSATLEARRFSDYFGGCPVIEVPGRTFPVEVRFLEDAVEETGYVLEEESEYAVRSRRVKHDEGTVKIAGKHGSTQTVRLQWEEDPTDAYYDSDPSESSGAPTINSTYAPRTLTTVNRMDPNRFNYDLLVLLLHHICFPASDILAAGTVPSVGAVLVFLPGLPEIRRLHDLLAADRRFADPEHCALYVLHSALASEGQEAAFEVPPIGVRKVVLATNIAETGVTIPDVTVVVDAGRVKVVRFDEKRKVTSLDEMFVSRASAKQRRGRAGRVQEGLCYHLFTRYRFENQLGDYLAPEMLRLPLSELCLKIKICRLGLIHDVLASALDPPPTTAVQNAIDSLVEVQALTSAERLTPLGVHLSNLPVDVHIGKMILFGAVLRCLDPVLTVAAYLSFKSPFIRPFGREAEADAAREGFKTGNSDLLTIYKAYTAWRDHARTLKPSQERDFCRRHFLSHQNLLTIEDMKKQFLGLLVAIGFVRVSSDEKIELSRNNYRRTTSAATFCAIPTFYDVHATNPAVLNAAFAAGLYPRVARCSPLTRELTTGQRQDIVHVHPSSVNFSRASEWSFPTDWLVYYTMVRSGKVYLWETGAVDACPLLMFGGEMEIKHKHRRVSIDHWIKFRCHAKTAVLFKCLRFELNKILRRKIDNPTMDFSEIDQRYLDLMVDVLEVGQQAK